MQIKKIIFLVFILLPLHVSFADEPEAGIAYLCDSKRKLFSLTSTFEINAYKVGGEELYTVIPLSGHSKVIASTDLRCIIDDTVITAHVHIIPPQATGACGGNTEINITLLEINGERVIENAISFNSLCEAYSAIDIEIRVIDQKTTTEICYEGLGERPYAIAHCDTYSR